MATLLPGTLEMLILRTLDVERMHGYAIAQHIARVSNQAFLVEKGSLYPALERLQRNGWVTAKWETSGTGRRARYYTITTSGRRALGDQVSAFRESHEAITRVLNPDPKTRT